MKKHDKVSLLTNRWRISRGIITRGFNYKMVVRDGKKTPVYSATAGSLVYNERDRFNILIAGNDHRQQSLVCFQSSIRNADDTRLLGIGAGDDHQYVLSVRIYMASRELYPDEYIKGILDDASEKLRTYGGDCKLLQLPPHIISEILANHPVPQPITEPESNLWWKGLWWKRTSVKEEDQH
jgi:hypothetical protein